MQLMKTSSPNALFVVLRVTRFSEKDLDSSTMLNMNIIYGVIT